MYTPLLSFTVSGNVMKNVAQQNVECIHLTIFKCVVEGHWVHPVSYHHCRFLRNIAIFPTLGTVFVLRMVCHYDEAQTDLKLFIPPPLWQLPSAETVGNYIKFHSFTIFCPFICWWVSRLAPFLHHIGCWSNKHRCANIYVCVIVLCAYVHRWYQCFIWLFYFYIPENSLYWFPQWPYQFMSHKYNFFFFILYIIF